MEDMMPTPRPEDPLGMPDTRTLPLSEQPRRDSAENILEKAPPENTITIIVLCVVDLAAIAGLILGAADGATLGAVATTVTGALAGSTMQSVRR